MPAESSWPETVHRAIRHSLFAGGKRLRPILCLAAAETLGAPTAVALAPACGFELVHTYSLVHDDLPAMDDAPLRRGAPTSHVVFGEAVAILAGDALLTLGLSVLARYPAGDRYAPAKLAILEIVTDAVGSGGMIGGQVADLEAERSDRVSGNRSGGPGGPPDRRDLGGGPGGPPSPLAAAERLLEIHEAKTGRLFRAALAAGGLLSFASEDVLAKLDACGRALGLAFQIKDDLLDVEADAATLGKRPGSDSAARKLTFPAVWGLERSRAQLEEKVREAEAHARSLPGGGDRLADLARFVGTRQA